MEIMTLHGMYEEPGGLDDFFFDVIELPMWQEDPDSEETLCLRNLEEVEAWASRYFGYHEINRVRITKSALKAAAANERTR